MNEYTITFTEDDGGGHIVLSQEDVNLLFDRYALSSAVDRAESGADRTATLGTLEITTGDHPMWHQNIMEPQVFADMLADAIVMAALEMARKTLGTEGGEPSADN